MSSLKSVPERLQPVKTEALTQNTGHMAWCALVALQLARQDGMAGTEAADSLFLTRWLATALKQRRFPRSVTPDLEWLVKQGGLYGVRARLAGKLDYLWRSCAGELSEQNDLFRLTYGLETAKDMGWRYRLLTEREWEGRYAVTLNGSVDAVYLLRAALDTAFDDNGAQLSRLQARITGNADGMATLLARCGWHVTAVPDDPCPYTFLLSTRAERLP